jgi:uncharacterized iron-regulated membrane protein
MSYWQRWISRPQTVWLRKAIFQVHLWCGIIIGLYVLLVSVTGSIVVYRNELYTAATRPPVVVAPSGTQLTDEELQAAAARAYPGYSISNISRGEQLDQVTHIYLDGPRGHKNRQFNPYTGEDLGDSVPPGIRFVSWLLELHDDLLGGETGRSINGFGALLVIVLALTGIIVWWPGIQTWRRSLLVHRNVGWKRFTWDLHSMIGFWTLGIIMLFGLSGAYLSSPQLFQDFVDRFDPPTAATAGNRFVDQAIYWLAYLHFGRINGIGIPCRGPGLCDQATKFVWALAGLAPAAMFVTGTVMWWNRVVRKKLKRRAQSEEIATGR